MADPSRHRIKSFRCLVSQHRNYKLPSPRGTRSNNNRGNDEHVSRFEFSPDNKHIFRREEIPVITSARAGPICVIIFFDEQCV